MTITATLVNLYHVCKRELWLHGHGIRMEHTSDVVYEGKLIGENTYTDRPKKNTQVELSIPLWEADADFPVGKEGKNTTVAWTGAAKIDYYDAKNHTVYETKKSDRTEQAHVAQVKFYLYVLLKSGIENPRGVIEYPKQRERTMVTLTPMEATEVAQWLLDIRAILEAAQCPAVIHKPFCRQCSYYDYCYADEAAY